MARKSILNGLVALGLTAVTAGVGVFAFASGSPSDAAAKAANALRLASPSVPGRVGMTLHTTATNLQCGQSITTSRTLNGDLVCSGGPGLRVTGDGVVLNLNGHVVDGPFGAGNGIVVAGTGDTVENGFVSRWTEGVFVTGSKDTVTKIRVSANSEGMVVAGPRAQIVKNTALENTGNGIRASGRNGTYTSNLVASNATGIAEQGIGDVLTGNITDSNTANGIDDQGGNSTLIKNIANYNRLDGIVVDDLVIAGFVDGGGNAAKGNDYGTGASPEQCRGVTCG